MMSLIRKINHMNNVMPFFEDKTLFDIEEIKRINEDIAKCINPHNKFKTKMSLYSSNDDNSEYLDMVELKKKLGDNAYIEYNGKEITLEDCYNNIDKNNVIIESEPNIYKSDNKKETFASNVPYDNNKVYVALLHTEYDNKNNDEKENKYDTTINLETLESMVDKIYRTLMDNNVNKPEVDFNVISNNQKDESTTEFEVEFNNNNDVNQPDESINKNEASNISFIDAYLDSMKSSPVTLKNNININEDEKVDNTITISNTETCNCGDNNYINHIEIEFDNDKVFKQKDLQSLWFNDYPSKLDATFASNNFKYLKIKNGTEIGNIIIKGYYINNDVKKLIDTLKYEDMVVIRMYHSDGFWSKDKYCKENDEILNYMLKSSFTFVTRKEYDKNLYQTIYSKVKVNDINCC